MSVSNRVPHAVFFIAFPVHECFNCLNYFTLLLLSERSNTSALSHHVMAVSQAKTGIYFTIRIRFAALFTVSSRHLAGKDPHFRGNVPEKHRNMT
ncbi:hypothetical protein E2051_15860 [Salmonella enterica subsp. enterica serovar Liverpool]|nr:hypothetical protein [Salmonella enterica subsp. enterica serovar Liverpool]